MPRWLRVQQQRIMNKQIYLRPMTFSRYDAKRCLVYLNEEVIENHVPADAPEDFKPVAAYAYSGSESDGGTLIDAADDSRDSLVNGIIRSRYSQSEEDAIKTHQIELLKNADIDKAEDYEAEWVEFNAFREKAKVTVDGWLKP